MSVCRWNTKVILQDQRVVGLILCGWNSSDASLTGNWVERLSDDPFTPIVWREQIKKYLVETEFFFHSYDWKQPMIAMIQLYKMTHNYDWSTNKSITLLGLVCHVVFFYFVVWSCCHVSRHVLVCSRVLFWLVVLSHVSSSHWFFMSCCLVPGLVSLLSLSISFYVHVWLSSQVMFFTSFIWMNYNWVQKLTFSGLSFTISSRIFIRRYLVIVINQMANNCC